MKVMIINSPLSAEEQYGGSSLESVQNFVQPLGIAYLAAVLEKSRFDVKLIDASIQNLRPRDIAQIVERENPQLVGISSVTISFYNAEETARAIREKNGNIYIVIGGPHVSTDPEGSIRKDLFDLGVVAEGEYTLLEIARELRDKGKINHPEKIKGIVYKRKNKVYFTEQRPYIEDLDVLPMPARYLLPPLKEYKATPASSRYNPVGTIITSRGCPNKCVFCDRKIFGNRPRLHSVKRVVDEIEMLVEKYGAREIKVWDDTFTFNQKRVIEICKEILKRRIKVHWLCLTRVNNVGEELYFWMKKAGCWQVLFGLESGDPGILKDMKKGITLEQSIKAVSLAKKAGLNVRGTFVLGMPNETKETLKRTLDFALSLPLDSANFYVLAPYQGTEIFELLKEQGKILHENLFYYQEMIDAEKGRLPFVPDALTEEYLKNFVAQAHKEFYLRPSYLLKQALSIRNFTQIKGYWDGFRAVIGM